MSTTNQQQADPEPEGAGEPTLKPCPLCGGKAVLRFTVSHGHVFAGSHEVRCSSCGVVSGRHDLGSVSGSRWNRRPVEDQQAAEIASLRARLATVERERDAAREGLRGMAAWLDTLLSSKLAHRGYADMSGHPHGGAVVPLSEIPEWDLRRKLDGVRSATGLAGAVDRGSVI